MRFSCGNQPLGGAFQVAEERVALAIYADEADDRMIGSGPMFSGAGIGLVGEGPDAEVWIVGDDGIGRHLGDLKLGGEAEEEDGEQEQLFHMEKFSRKLRNWGG